MESAELDGLLVALTSGDHASVSSEADRAMLDYTNKLTLAPHDVNKDDIIRLRQEGFDDLAIHDICAIAAYFAFVNRIADGLGVELEEPS
jgi:uncharacterized peroxidase-related enzyme